MAVNRSNLKFGLIDTIGQPRCVSGQGCTTRVRDCQLLLETIGFSIEMTAPDKGVDSSVKLAGSDSLAVVVFEGCFRFRFCRRSFGGDDRTNISTKPTLEPACHGVTTRGGV